MNLLTVNRIRPINGVQTIKLRISRLWDCVQNISRLRYGIAFIGIDYQGNGIHVQIFESLAHLFRGRLIEGNIYQITDFHVSNAEIPDISTQTPYIIFLHVNTVLQQASDLAGVYARHFFDFTGEDNFDDEKRWEIHLTDVIGVIKSITRHTYSLLPSGNTVGKKDIRIMTLRGQGLDITLYEHVYNTLDIPMIIASRPRPAVIFAGMRVRQFYTGVSLCSTSASRTYVNLDIPETYARMDEVNGRHGNHD
ncbi:Nucleic acid-binding protein [Corchorus olitorius]|uniref:Nucleic acid-binding protein n=1 Tax=Corchorus olitorius TaxID=93759 RepID=A0A1R3I7I6_9ROSI|nr:Nucleic acid-binding protein [Corchorus olitorius]